MTIRLLDESHIRLSLAGAGFSIESDELPLSPFHMLAAGLASCTAIALGSWAVDSLKYAGGSFAVMDARSVRRLNEVAHAHDVAVSTGGFIERVVTFDAAHVEPYLRACRDLGFDIVEVSAGFIDVSDDEFVRLIERVVTAGLRAVAEVGIQRGAGGASAPAALERAGTVDTWGRIW